MQSTIKRTAELGDSETAQGLEIGDSWSARQS